ncbi:MAG: hypothetical protein AAFV53_40600, partial [Myxococcota bacterium]
MASVTQLGRPLSQVGGAERVTYLKRVMLWTTGGLTFTALVAAVMTAVLYGAAVNGFTTVLSPWFSFIAIMGSFAIANYVAPRFVFGEQKVFGFLMACFFEGISFGWLLLSPVSAVRTSAEPMRPKGLPVCAPMRTAESRSQPNEMPSKKQAIKKPNTFCSPKTNRDRQLCGAA